MENSLELLLKILVCPKCRGNVEPLGGAGQTEGLACNACGIVYPVLDGIPDMLMDDAIPRADWDAGKRGKLPN